MLIHSYELETRLIYGDKSEKRDYLSGERVVIDYEGTCGSLLQNVENVLCLGQNDSYMSVFRC